MMKLFSHRSDKTRAIATFTLLMLVWPMALAASYGMTLQPLGLGSMVPMCAPLGLPQQGDETPALAEPCPMCLAGSQAALVGGKAVELPDIPVSSFSIACGEHNASRTAVTAAYFSRAPPFFS